MGNDGELQKTLNKQELKTVELQTSKQEHQENAGMAPVINEELEKFKTETKKKVPLFAEEEKTLGEFMGDAIQEYDKKLKADEKDKAFDYVELDEIENLTMTELLERMEKDGNTKHKAFREMENALRALVNFNKNLARAKKNGTVQMDYNDVFRLVETTAKYYQTTHKKWLHLTSYGKERYKMSCRILDIMTGLKSYCKEKADKFNEIDQKTESARIEDILDDNKLTEKEKGELIGDWLENGAEYKEVLQKLLADQKLLDKDKQALARIVADKNRRLVANKVTLSLVCDENLKLTFGLSSLKTRLNKYISEKIELDDDSKKVLFEDVAAFREHISKLLDDYKNENKDLLERTEKRKQKFVSELGINENDTTFWTNSDVNELLTDSDDEVFDIKLDIYKNQCADNKAIVDQLIDDLGYSSLTSDLIKEKVIKELGVFYLKGGEITVSEKVKDCIKMIKYLAAEEFEAEGKISHIMDVCQIPKADKDSFAKYLSKDGTVGGILAQKTSELRGRGDQFMENLAGINTTEAVIKNKKLMLKEESWLKIEDLKNRMGTLSKKEFKAELSKIIKDNNAKIDLSKPNMNFGTFYKSRTKQRVRQDIGFTARIMGDLFLGSKEITELLDKQEIQYFKNNILRELTSGRADIGDLEFLPTGSIKAIANMLKKNLIANKKFIQDLRKEFQDNPAVINETLMQMSMSSETLNISDLNDIVQRIKERHEYDNKVTEEKEKMLEALKAGGSNDASLSKERYFNFLKQLDHLKTCKMGRYALIAQHLVSENEVFKVMMEGNTEVLDTYLENVLEKRIGTAIDAIFSSNLQKAFKQIYVDKKFKDIFSGKLTGNIALFKDDMRREQKNYFDQTEFDEGKVDKNITDASNTAIRKIVGRSRKNVGKISLVYACTEAVVNSCYEDKEKVKILTSKVSLTNEITKAYERYDDNRMMVERAIRELGSKEGSVFYGYSIKKGGEAKDAYLNAASFISNISRKMMITDKAELEKELPKLIENYESIYRKNKELTDKSKVSEDEVKKGKDFVSKKASTQKVREDRDKLIGLSDYQTALRNIYSNKALVTIGTDKATSLSHDNWQKARDYVNKKLSPIYSFDPFLVDLLVEKNVNSIFNNDIDIHAKWLYNVSDILSKEDEKEEKISEDEHKLLVVHAYRHMEEFKDDSEDGYSSERKKIKAEWYKTFRKNYQDLKKLEELPLDFAPLEQERISLSRDLRAILATGVDIKDQDKKEKNSFTNKANEAVKYLTYVNEFMKCANEALSENELYQKENELHQNDYLLALRQYYHDRIFSDLKNAKKSTFDADAWKNDFKELAKDNAIVRFMRGIDSYESVSDKTISRKNKNFSELIGRDDLEKLIKEKGSIQCNRKYKALSESEKELFALGLMLMEKGAIGFDAGSVSVLSKGELRDKEVKPRLEELAKYMAGQDYDFKVDYTQAYYKLTNIGENFWGDVDSAFSKSAFEKALQFAKAITGKMEQKDDKVTKEDKDRMGDGISSIYEAAVLGKKDQIEEVDELRKYQFTPQSVKDKLLEYAKKDEDKLKTYEKVIDTTDTIVTVASGYIGAPITKVYLNETREEIKLRKKCVSKLEKLDEIDMHKLLAILQNRTVLDDSSAGEGKHIDEDKREEIKLLFSEDNQDKAFEQFVKPGACMQALISALSFKIQDKRTLQGTKLTGKDFDSKSYDRKSLIDWRLLDKAFSFLEELEKDKLTRFAIRNAPNYIEASGNKKAIEAYKENVKGKDEKSITRDNIEDFLKKEAEKDRLSKDNLDAKLALSGYKKLSEAQKKLFFKVLGRRDFLDISKKNLYRNIFSSSKERNFANETGRFRLIDEYIDQSLRGNKGVVLSETAYTDAFKSLLSTQVDDTADFESAEHVGEVLSKEKYYVMKRDTAVDWKLFIRALQFVNRASYELDMREGNDELYRSSGDITRYGHLSMDYSILRRNIHNTGNQFFRAGVQQGKKLLTKDALDDIKIVGGMSLIQLKDNLKTVTDIIAPSLSQKLNDLDEILKVDEAKKKSRLDAVPDWLTKDPRKIDYKKLAIAQGKDMLTGKLYTKEASFSNQINDLVLNAFLDGVNVDKIGGLIKEKLKEKPVPGKEATLDSIIGDFKVESQYGDVRDEIAMITEKYNEYSGLPKKLQKQVYDKLHGDTIKQILNLSVASSVKSFIESKYAEATAFVLSKIDVTKGTVDTGDNNNSFVKEVKSFVMEAVKTSKDAKKFLADLQKEPQKLVNKVQAKAKEITGTIIEEAIGKEGIDYIKDKTELLTGLGKTMLDKVAWVTDKINKYKVYIDGFADIALSIKNKKLIYETDSKASSQETRKKDQETLKKGEEFVDERQKKVRNNAVAEHKDMQTLSMKTADTIQDMAIADDVIKMSMALGKEIFGKIDAGVATKLVTEAVNAGIEFAMYCIRCVKDFKMMKSYYTDTERGQQVVNDIKKGYEELAGSKQVMEAELMNRDTLDIVCLGNGYESKDELIRDTGMKMATSIAFCASNYNPVKETKVMATTVMIVLGLKDKIGKTDIGTIAGIFDKMKSA